MNMRWWMIFFRLDAITAAINHVFISTIRFGGISNKKRIETNIKRRSEVKRKKQQRTNKRTKCELLYANCIPERAIDRKKNTKQKKSTEMQIKFECWKLVENDGKMCIILHRLHALNIHLNRHFVSTTDFWTFYLPYVWFPWLYFYQIGTSTTHRIVSYRK